MDIENKPSFNTNLSSDPLSTEPGDFNPEKLTSPNFDQEEIKPGMTKEQPNSKEHELINSKLDTIKALLNSLDQRIANIENATGAEKQKPKNLW